MKGVGGYRSFYPPGLFLCFYYAKMLLCVIVISFSVVLSYLPEGCKLRGIWAVQHIICSLAFLLLSQLSVFVIYFYS